jgi:gamma-glutamyl:cysteine ligase YbdK (ATP-grasp superfamily)
MKAGDDRINRGAAAAALSLGILLAGCTGSDPQSQAGACRSGLDTAYAEFNQAKADGLGEAVDMTKAGSLLAAAKVQEQFEEYNNCIEKVNRARHYIRQARQGG